MINYLYLGKKIFKNNLKKMFIKLLSLIKLSRLKKFQAIYKSLTFIL